MNLTTTTLATFAPLLDPETGRLSDDPVCWTDIVRGQFREKPVQVYPVAADFDEGQTLLGEYDDAWSLWSGTTVLGLLARGNTWRWMDARTKISCSGPRALVLRAMLRSTKDIPTVSDQTPAFLGNTTAHA